MLLANKFGNRKPKKIFNEVNKLLIVFDPTKHDHFSR